MFTKIFISYAKEDYQYAENLHSYLKKNGFSPWLDKINLLPGQQWDFYIQQELRRADFIILLLSETSVKKRGYVQKEFNIALKYCQEKLDTDVYLIPIKINACEIPEKLSKFHWVEYSSENAFEKILESINLQRGLLINEFKQKQSSQIGFDFKIEIKKGEYGIKSPKQIFEIQYPIFINKISEITQELGNLIENEVLQYLLNARKNYFEILDGINEESDYFFSQDSTLYGKIEFQLLTSNFISYKSFWSLYETGAIHGNYWSIGHNYYLNPIRNFNFENLFVDIDKALIIIRDIIQDKFSIIAKNEYELKDVSELYILPEGLTAVSENFNNYYLTNKSIVFVYNPYHLTAFSFGDHHIEISFEELLNKFPIENKLKDFINMIILNDKIGSC